MARAFNGSNQNVSCGDQTILDFADGMSFSAWFLINNVSNDYCICEKGSGSPDLSLGRFLVFFDVVGANSARTQMLSIRAASNGSSDTWFEGASGSIVANAWFHALVTWDITAGTVRAYLNGTEDANSPGTGTGGSEADFGGSDPLIFGERSAGTMDMDGRIAECAMWVHYTDASQGILSANEARMLASGVSPLRIRPNQLRLYLPMGHASPEPDYSGYLRSGTVTGATVGNHAPVSPMFAYDAQYPHIVTAAVVGDDLAPYMIRGNTLLRM